MTIRSLLAVLIMAPTALLGCSGEEQAGADAAREGMSAAAQPMGSEAQELVNRGNEALRAANYQGAMELFQEAMGLIPGHPVPQFGALMAAMALGDESMTDSLSAILQETSPALLAMLRPDGSMGGGMPANPHAQGMPGGMPGGTPSDSEGGMTPMEGLPQGHPTLYEVEPGDTTAPDTTGLPL